MKSDQNTKLYKGGCYVYKAPSGDYYGFMITYITKYCYFLNSGKKFSHLPPLNEFKKAGLWGKKVPVRLLTDLKISLARDFILRKTLLADIDNIFFLGIEEFNGAIEVGSSGQKENMSAIANTISNYKSFNEKRKNERFFNPYEVFPWSTLLDNEKVLIIQNIE